MFCKNIIAIVSSKEGVGKSTIALNLALALQKEGIKVGLFDANIYGLTNPHLWGIDQSESSNIRKHFESTEAYGLPIFSIAHILSPSPKSVVFESSSEHMLVQLFFKIHWPELDCLIIDLPSGIQDLQLSVIQKISVTDVVMVTTPHDKAILEVRKAVTLLKKINIPVMGVIENMATYFYAPFKYPRDPRDESLVSPYTAPLLGQLIVDSTMGEAAQTGVPWLKNEAYQEHSNTAEFYKIARKISSKIRLRGTLCTAS